MPSQSISQTEQHCFLATLQTSTCHCAYHQVQYMHTYCQDYILIPSSLSANSAMPTVPPHSPPIKCPSATTTRQYSKALETRLPIYGTSHYRHTNTISPAPLTHVAPSQTALPITTRHAIPQSWQPGAMPSTQLTTLRFQNSHLQSFASTPAIICNGSRALRSNSRQRPLNQGTQTCAHPNRHRHLQPAKPGTI